jgi:glycerol kinase
VLLGIDQGTTGTTVLAVDRRGRVVGRGTEEIPPRFPRPGWVEHDPETLYQSVLRASRTALRRAGARASEVEGIGITNQRETTLLWDRATGEPVAPAIVWQCRRTAEACEALRRRGLEPEVRRRTGLVLDPYFSATKVRWLLDRVPGLERRAERGDVAFGTVDAWLVWRLTGGRVHATDPTNASRTLLYDLRAGRFTPRLCALFGVPQAVLPEVRPTSGSFGETVRAGPFPAGLPILAVAGDQQASLVGHGCLHAGEAKCTYGTGAFLLLHTGSRIVPSAHGCLTTAAWGGSDAPAYALEGAVFSAGSAVQWLRDGLGLVRDAAETEAIARRTRDTGGVHVVPAFTGLGAPWWDAGARAAVLGITRGTGRDEVVRATLEALAWQTKDVLDAMRLDARVPLARLRVDGGAAANDWLLAFLADVLGVPVARPRSVESTALGAALLAGAAFGTWTPARIARGAAPLDRTFRPRMGAAERRRRHAAWLEAVARVRTGGDAPRRGRGRRRS